jgi:integrase/recombinase XerD
MFTVKWNKAANPAGVELIDSEGQPVLVACQFLAHIAARGCSPNTALAYAHDLAHLWSFLAIAGLQWQHVSVEKAVDLLGYLRSVPSKRRGPALGLELAAEHGLRATRRLSAATVNRALAAVSSFYDWAILTGRFDSSNPLTRVVDRAITRVTERHRPFFEGISRRQPMSRVLRVKAVYRLPRPMSKDQVDALLGELRSLRDRALVHLMLDGGLRPGEALGLHLSDIAYGRRRITVRWRDDHPKGVRSKSRVERIVDLHDVATLPALSAYVMAERPAEAESSIVFLVGGNGRRRCEPLSYAALVRLFARACERSGIREPWITPHALRHTHATRMWEAGMRELTLQRRLGHASPESTRIYTRVSDEVVVAEYRRALGLESQADSVTRPVEEQSS